VASIAAWAERRDSRRSAGVRRWFMIWRFWKRLNFVNGDSVLEMDKVVF